MKMSEIFREAKTKLHKGRRVGGKERYICYAISRIKAPHADIRRAKWIVQSLLHPHLSLEGWLTRTQGVNTAYSNEGNAKMQVTRQAWLDHLIEHYEAQGD